MTPQASDVGDIFSISQKVGLTAANFWTRIVPPFVGQYLMGVLVQLEGTRFYRLALLPVTLWFAWRGIFVDMSGGDPMQAQANTVLITQMATISMRNVMWACAREPYRRRDERASQKQIEADQDSENIYTALWNAWDLMLNMRGIGWNWGRGITFPKPIFETDSRIAFVALSFIRLVFHVLGFDATLQVIRMIFLETSGSSAGETIFNPSLPPHLQLLRSLVVSGLAILMAYFAMEWSYQFVAIVFVIVFQQRPSQWPPLFDAPWLSTSLSELWGRRWHQMLRHMLLYVGAQPFNYVLGRVGGVIGVFLVSGLFHDIELRSVGRGGNSIVVMTCFVMCGVGILLERAWRKVTGRSVGGVLGWIWTFGWLAVWGVPLVDAWAKAGRFSGVSLPGGLEPSVALVSFVRGCIHA